MKRQCPENPRNPAVSPETFHRFIGRTVSRFREVPFLGGTLKRNGAKRAINEQIKAPSRREKGEQTKTISVTGYFGGCPANSATMFTGSPTLQTGCGGMSPHLKSHNRLVGLRAT